MRNEAIRGLSFGRWACASQFYQPQGARPMSLDLSLVTLCFTLRPEAEVQMTEIPDRTRLGAIIKVRVAVCFWILVT